MTPRVVARAEPPLSGITNYGLSKNIKQLASLDSLHRYCIRHTISLSVHSKKFKQ